MTSFPVRSGYTLPVFACAAAIAALRCLQEHISVERVTVELLEPSETVGLSIEQVARLHARAALAMTRSEPGDNLDLTRHTPIWALVEVGEPEQEASIVILGGEGLGRIGGADGPPAIYSYAHRLLQANLQQWLVPGGSIRVTLILPEGRRLAQRTSNAAFGVVDGLSLLGTTGISQPLSAPGQLDEFRAELRRKTNWFDGLVFCIGENGLDLAQQLGVRPERRLKTANWLGPLLVEAGQQGVQAILLFGYHGKLIKLAGGIFHTHHHLADGRMEILAAQGIRVGLPLAHLQALLACPTVEAGLTYLRQLDQETGSQWVAQVYETMAQTIDQRSRAYIQTHIGQDAAALPQIGTLLFDRQRQVIKTSKVGATLLEQVC